MKPLVFTTVAYLSVPVGESPILQDQIERDLMVVQGLSGSPRDLILQQALKIGLFCVKQALIAEEVRIVDALTLPSGS